ncbi:MAG: hypothetical protein PHH20_04415 [Candidatus Omnitrophica bacterium]|nr:hypothetical protein [Candidatus Omnitrophota bacterium]
MMKCTLILSVVLLLFTFSTTTCTAEEKKITPIGNFQALGGYSDSNKSDGLWGYNISGSYAPTVKLNDTQYLIPLYSGAFERMRQYITQEEGGRFYNMWQLHNASLALRTKHSEEWVSRFGGIATWNLLKETQDEEFGKGLYDYRDFGFTFDLRQTVTMPAQKEHIYDMGFEYFRRTYPNYRSLISLASTTAPEVNEKDFDGFKFSWGYEDLSKSGLSWDIKPSLLLKSFIDKKLINEDGTLNGSSKRKDYVLTNDMGFDMPVFGNDRFVLSGDGNVTYNHSNLDLYDSRGTLILNDDIYTERYYSFLSASAYPYITYYHPIGKDKILALRGGYSFLYRHYPGRKAQEVNGDYTDSKQHDREHAVHFSSSYPITKELSWVTYFDYSWVKSNQKYEQFYTYTYNIYQVQSGISVQF